MYESSEVLQQAKGTVLTPDVVLDNAMSSQMIANDDDSDDNDEDDGKTEGSLSEGEWLSEAAIWVKWHNRGRLHSGTRCCFLTLEAKLFADVLLHHRDIYAWAVMYAKEFVQSLWQQ